MTERGERIAKTEEQVRENEQEFQDLTEQIALENAHVLEIKKQLAGCRMKSRNRMSVSANR